MNAVETRDGVGLRCPRCGAAMASEQDWCLECGLAATTRVVPPPRWGVPVAIVLVVLAIAGGGLALAIDRLSNDADKSAARHAATRSVARAPASRPARSSPSGPTVPAAVGAPAKLTAWPAGKQAYSVIVLTATSRAAAQARARLLARQGTPAGVLRSADFKGLQPGFFLTFAGRFGDQARAQAAAQRLAGGGQRGYATLIAPR